MWRGGHSKGVLIAALALLVSACAGPSQPSPDSVATSASGLDGTAGDGDDVAEQTAPRGECDIADGEPFAITESVEMTDLGEVDGARVSAAVYPHPDYEGNPWSQWGQGLIVEDGRYYSAIGDHLAVDGNSYVYEYDPATGTLTMIGDILSYVDHVPGTWGYGKVHSQMVPGPCGEIYFSTYWGSFRDIQFEGNYTGDILFRLDPFGGTLRSLEVPVEFHGQASMGSAPSSGVVYGEAVDPVLRGEGIEKGPFFVYDVVTEEVVYTGPDEPHVGYRSILVDSNGVAYYSVGGGELQSYDPMSGETATHDHLMPGEWLRAVTEPDPDGSVYGVTVEPDTFFVMRPDGSIESLGDSIEYTASIALSPDGSTFYYMPGAHGYSAEWGSPLVAVDTATGEQTVVAELNDIVEENLGYTVGGTYNIVISPDGGTVFMGVNVGEPGGNGFGEVVLLVIELP